MRRLFLSFIICYLSFIICPAGAWRITPDLQKELAQKQAAVRVSPNDAQARFELAITQAYTNNIIDGMSTITKIPKIDPVFKNKALQIYIDKVKANPQDWKLRFRLAFVYYFNDEKKDAIREFDNVLILDPNNIWAYGYQALVYGDLGNVDKAIELAKKGLAIDSNAAALHLLLSEGYYKKGDSWKGWAERFEALRLRALGY
jgi:tetratricopeptide (TPR) repeat protein